MRLFSLEYLRQLINADLTHFCSANKRSELRIKTPLGPFVIHKREAWKDADKILGEHLKLKKSFCWVPYDPNSFISERKVRNRLSAYVHHRIPGIEQFSNHDDWVEVTLVEEIIEQEKMEKAMKDLEKPLTSTILDRYLSSHLNKQELVHPLLELLSNLYKKPTH